MRAFSRTKYELRILPYMVQVWRILRTTSIETVQIEPRSPEVLQHIGIVSTLKTGHRIKCKVMRDELPEVCVSSGYDPVVRSVRICGPFHHTRSEFCKV